ncbi:MAG: CPBP family intramembrane metalloprotease [Caulobacteraceae bacterium]|nr:CPBP family intramembrane metalloprotease [Caulobacteraceae bacterium]
MMTYLDYARRGANDWWRFVVAFGLAMVFWTAMIVLLVAALFIARLPVSQFGAWISDTSRPVSFFGFNGLAFLMLVVAFAAAIRWVQHKRFQNLIGAWTWRRFGAGFGVWTIALVAASLLDFALAPHGFRASACANTLPLAISALAGLGIQTFAEEFIFRGYLTQGLLLAIRRPLPVALISGLLFGALHIPNGPPQAVNAVFFGVILALIAMRTGGIAFTYGLHLANNLFSAVVVVSSKDVFGGSPALFTQNTPGLMWWDTGVGAVALIVLALMMDRIPWRPSGAAEPAGDAA